MEGCYFFLIQRRPNLKTKRLPKRRPKRSPPRETVSRSSPSFGVFWEACPGSRATCRVNSGGSDPAHPHRRRSRACRTDWGWFPSNCPEILISVASEWTTDKANAKGEGCLTTANETREKTYRLSAEISGVRRQRRG